jgi:hypothetical protein
LGGRRIRVGEAGEVLLYARGELIQVGGGPVVIRAVPRADLAAQVQLITSDCASPDPQEFVPGRAQAGRKQVGPCAARLARLLWTSIPRNSGR